MLKNRALITLPYPNHYLFRDSYYTKTETLFPKATERKVILQYNKSEVFLSDIPSVQDS